MADDDVTRRVRAAKSRAYREANKEKLAEYQRAYRERTRRELEELRAEVRRLRGES